MRFREPSAGPFAAPPELPAGRAGTLRRAFDETMTDRDFLADATKGKLPILPINGEKLQTMVSDLYDTPAQTIERVRKILATPAAKK